MSEQYYPSLSSLIKIDDLPEQLNFLQTGVNGLTEVFDKVYYQNLEINHANSGAVSSYQLDLVSLHKLAWDIPGTGLTLAFDTNFETNDNISIIPTGFTFALKPTIIQHISSNSKYYTYFCASILIKYFEKF